MWHSSIINRHILCATNRPGFPETRGNIYPIQVVLKETSQDVVSEHFMEAKVEDFGISFLPIYSQLKDIHENITLMTNKSTRGYISKVLKETKRCFFLSHGSITHINPIELMNTFREEIIELCAKHPHLLLNDDPSFEKIWSALAYDDHVSADILTVICPKALRDFIIVVYNKYSSGHSEFTSAISYQYDTQGDKHTVFMLIEDQYHFMPYSQQCPVEAHSNRQIHL